MALTFVHHGHRHVLLNIYAPSDREARERFYAQLPELDDRDVTSIMGGDFNATLRSTDRSHNTTRTHGSAALLRYFDHARLIDAVPHRDPSPAWTCPDIEAYEDHTFLCSTPAGQVRASRLDRWYVSESDQRRLRGVHVVGPWCRPKKSAK
ncbi:TPA: hypothetical protein N0F65_010945 [Lagenidium giganteum]|uniref:Endonuclease/exonuclease/phosphatase domain-containing protein n=1 Tax=Lagenidium giganteum TaxID=4803 RepID=A0AAV2Z2U5_9STRA|nr:TPA: hypothetical protein N0F65_010945 [Lagenidium giganteum]